MFFLWFSPATVLLPEAGHGPLMRDMSSMAMSPAIPPTVASRITWWTLCKVTWLWTSSHSSPWFPDFCHTYRKDRRLIHSSQWGCEEVCATLQNALKLCSLHSLYKALMLFCNQHFTTMWNDNNREKSLWEQWQIFLNPPHSRFSDTVVKGSNVSRLKEVAFSDLCYL